MSSEDVMLTKGPSYTDVVGVLGNTQQAVRKLMKLEWREEGRVQIKISPTPLIPTGDFTGKSFFFNIVKDRDEYSITPSDKTEPLGKKFLDTISTDSTAPPGVGFLLVNIESLDAEGNTIHEYPNVRIIKQTPGRDTYQSKYRIGKDLSKGGSIRSHYRKRKSSRHVSNKKYSMGRRGRNRGRSRSRSRRSRSRKN
jgi:hypothetical protein